VEFKAYPAWRYHRTLEPRIVKDPGEDEALGPGWASSPADLAGPESSDTPKKPRKKGK